MVCIYLTRRFRSSEAEGLTANDLKVDKGKGDSEGWQRLLLMPAFLRIFTPFNLVASSGEEQGISCLVYPFVCSTGLRPNCHDSRSL